MQNAPLVPDYDQNEERINYISHGVGAGLSIVAGILLIIKGSYLSTGQWIGLWVYALSMILLFSASMLYHMATAADRRYFIKSRSYCDILFNRRNLYPFPVNCHSDRQSPVFIDCAVGDCPSWYTFQVRFHSSFPETFFGGLSGHGLAGAAGD